VYVPCRPDWKDAHEKINHIVKHWDDYRPMRERAKKMVFDAWPAGAIAKQLTDAIKRLCDV
jgi:hypothetical protein